MNVDGAFLPSTRNSRAIIAANVFHSVGCGTGASVISAAIEAVTSGPPAAAPMLAGWVVVAIGLLLPVLAAGQGKESGLQAGLGHRRVADLQAVGRAEAHQVAEQAFGIAAEDTELVTLGLDLADAGALGQPVGHRVLVPDGDDRLRAGVREELVE